MGKVIELHASGPTGILFCHPLDVAAAEQFVYLMVCVKGEDILAIRSDGACFWRGNELDSTERIREVMAQVGANLCGLVHP